METDSTEKEEMVAKERTLDAARGRDKRHGGNLKLTKRPNETKKTTIIEPRRKGLWRKWLCKIIAQRTGILFFLWLNLVQRNTGLYLVQLSHLIGKEQRPMRAFLRA